MSGRGETPEADDEDDPRDGGDAHDDDDTYALDGVSVEFGTAVYDENGQPLGKVRGVEEGGFFVTTREGVESLSVEHARSGHDFGQAELMWRCTECGKMGEIDDGLPGECPNCGSPKEALMYWTED